MLSFSESHTSQILESSLLKNLETCISKDCPRSRTSSFTQSTFVLPLKKGRFAGITKFSQTLGYTIANNLNINFGKIVVNQILYVMRLNEIINIETHNVEYFFPRILQLILNDVLTLEEKARYANLEISESSKLKNNVIIGVEGRGDYVNNHPAVFTEFIHGLCG